MVPGDAVAKINAQLTRAGAKPLVADSLGAPAIANFIFHSLAERYANVLRSIESTAKKKLRRVFIVGGGNKNQLLNRLTREKSGLDVVLGSAESTTIGNFAIQLAALGRRVDSGHRRAGGSRGEVGAPAHIDFHCHPGDGAIRSQRSLRQVGALLYERSCA